jgi:hypothetical protein
LISWTLRGTMSFHNGCQRKILRKVEGFRFSLRSHSSGYGLDSAFQIALKGDTTQWVRGHFPPPLWPNISGREVWHPAQDEEEGRHTKE